MFQFIFLLIAVPLCAQYPNQVYEFTIADGLPSDNILKTEISSAGVLYSEQA